MKKNIVIVLAAMLLAALIVPAAFAQMAQVKGSVRDEQGQPIANATIEYHNQENGRKVTLKTDKSGNYFSIGVPSGTYKVTMAAEGRQPISFNNVRVTLQQEVNEFNINLQTERARMEQTLSAEERAKREAAKQEQLKVKDLNERLAQSNALKQQGDFDGAIALLAQAVQAGPQYDILWYKLGETELASATKMSDKEARNQRLQQTIEHLQKAIAIKPTVGEYFNKLGEAHSRLGNTEEALKQYELAAQAEPTNAGMYYFNAGAILTNQGKVDAANSMFDKAIQANPNHADAYYQKGINLMAKGTVDPKTGTTKYPPEVASNLQKYLELQPEGSYAQGAKDLLSALGEKVETTYRKPGSKKK